MLLNWLLGLNHNRLPEAFLLYLLDPLPQSNRIIEMLLTSLTFFERRFQREACKVHRNLLALLWSCGSSVLPGGGQRLQWSWCLPCCLPLVFRLGKTGQRVRSPGNTPALPPASLPHWIDPQSKQQTEPWERCQSHAELGRDRPPFIIISSGHNLAQPTTSPGHKVTGA